MTQMELSSEAGFISLREMRCETENLRFERSDVVILFSSFEKSALAITNARNVSASKVVVYQFTAPDDDNERTKVSDELFQWAQGFSLDVSRVSLPMSTMVREVEGILKASLMAWHEEFGRPFSLILDITGCPKAYYSFLLACGVATGIVSKVQVHYGESALVPVHLTGARQYGGDVAVTSGNWIPIQPAYLEGRYKAGMPRHAIIFLGTDPSSVEKLIRRYDPESLSLVIPAVESDGEEGQAWINTANRISRNFDDVKYIWAEPSSVVNLINQMDDDIREKGDNSDILVFCLGTKPHALAMSVMGLNYSDLQLIFRIPEKYIERNRVSTGWSWVYYFVDTSNPHLA